MKKIIGNVLVALVMIGFVCFAATSGEAKNVNQMVNVTVGDQDFLLINSTEVEIYALYVTPHNANDWGEDILGVDTLYHDEDLLINFPSKTKSKFWDLRVEDEDGTYIEWDNLNLLKISSVELFYKNKKATAILN